MVIGFIDLEGFIDPETLIDGDCFLQNMIIKSVFRMKEAGKFGVLSKCPSVSGI